MFDANVMAEIGRVMRSLGKADDNLQRELQTIGEWARSIIDTTPTDFARGPEDVTLHRRSHWLAVDVIDPAERLCRALDLPERLAPYPETYANTPDAGSIDDLRQRLHSLHAFAVALKSDLDQRIVEKARL